MDTEDNSHNHNKMKDNIKKAKEINESSRQLLDSIEKKTQKNREILDKVDEKLMSVRERLAHIKKIKIETVDFVIETLKSLLAISFAGFVATFAISSVNSLVRNVQWVTLGLSVIFLVSMVIALFKRNKRVTDFENAHLEIVDSYIRSQDLLMKQSDKTVADIGLKLEQVDKNNADFDKEMKSIDVFLAKEDK